MHKYDKLRAQKKRAANMPKGIERGKAVIKAQLAFARYKARFELGKSDFLALEGAEELAENPDAVLDELEAVFHEDGINARFDDPLMAKVYAVYYTNCPSSTVAEEVGQKSCIMTSPGDHSLIKKDGQYGIYRTRSMPYTPKGAVM